jgi:hypothetical protein
MKRLLAIVGALIVPPAAAAATLLAVPDGRGIVLRADSREIAAIELPSLRPAWIVAGVRDPHLLVLSADGRWAAAVDAISSRVALVDLTERTSRLQALPETPVAAAFLDDALFVVSRDARILSRVDPAGGAPRTAELPPGTTHMLALPDGVIVYSPVTGAAARLDPSTLRTLASASLPRFGSALAEDGRRGYLTVPRSGQLVVFSLDTLALDHQRAAGAVPIDLAIEGEANAARAARIAIADPSSKRVWRDEGAQSTAAALGRGFLRGLLGLRLYSPRSTGFPNGVDRVIPYAGRLLAFDSSTGTVFAVDGGQVTAMATGVPWGSFAPAGGDLLVAREGAIERHPLP